MNLEDVFSPVEIVRKAINCFNGLNISVNETDDDIYPNQDGKAIEIEDWIYLYPVKTLVRHNGISPTAYQERRWIVTYGYIVPGVRYYRDGSGEPDDWDEKELASEVTLTKAIHVAAETMYSHSINAVLENMDYEVMAKEEVEQCETL